MQEYQWIHQNMNLFFISDNKESAIEIKNTGILNKDFYKYAFDFYKAAEHIFNYLVNNATQLDEFQKLDLWFFPMIYLYRQCLELLLKACIFQTITETNARKNIIGKIRHALKQAFLQLIEIRELSLNENGRWLMSYLSDISFIDKESDMFRYPFGYKLRTLFKTLTNISLLKTHDNIKKAFLIITNLYSYGKFPKQVYKFSEPKLIINGTQYALRCVVGYGISEYSFYPYFYAYKEVANFLSTFIKNSNNNSLFLSMCYLYRNAIELGLKRLILEESCKEKTQALKIITRKKHSIQGLWNSIKQEIKENINYSDLPTFENATQCISELHKLDKTSDLFRYPCNKNMEPYFLTQTKFDIKNLISYFEGLCNLLDSIDSMFEMRKDFLYEKANNNAIY